MRIPDLLASRAKRISRSILDIREEVELGENGVGEVGRLVLTNRAVSLFAIQCQ